LAEQSLSAPADAPRRPVLTLRGISKSYGPVSALRDVDLDVTPGEVVALVGDNGAGKSTLIKVIAGVHRFDGGEMRVEGVSVRPANPADARALGVSVVYQDLALCDNLDVVANIYLGVEGRRGGLLDEISMEESATELLRSLSVRIGSVRSKVADLSGGQRQCLAIARALIGDPKLVVLDEPTAALGVEQTAVVLQTVRRLADQGRGVVVISHNLADVFEIADRIVVLRLGTVADQFVTSETTREAVVAAITGARVAGGVS
jgi:D-xylose transport system ATP-binding protein